MACFAQQSLQSKLTLKIRPQWKLCSDLEPHTQGIGDKLWQVLCAQCPKCPLPTWGLSWKAESLFVISKEDKHRHGAVRGLIFHLLWIAHCANRCASFSNINIYVLLLK